VFLHAPEAVAIDVVVVEVVDIDGVAIVIRLAVDKIILRTSLACAGYVTKRRNVEWGARCAGTINWSRVAVK
jgi:hypothetical protein